MKAFIVESNYPKDFYHRALDGFTVRNLLNTIQVECELRMVLDEKHFALAIEEAVQKECHVFHLSCHGDDNGIALSDNTPLSWDAFAEMFQKVAHAPEVLVMSTCCGASGEIGKAFTKRKKRPKIIFGSTKALSYSQYCAAWAILYHRLASDGVSRDAAQNAIRQIVAVVDDSFMYRRWYDLKKQYRYYPGKGIRFVVKQA